MTRPRYSIVVPVRERPETLAATLRTCLAVEHDDYEVVVFDNASGPGVREAVDSVAMPRGPAPLRYERSDELLPMTQNWNAAVGHARGEYVIVIGNDDAI